MNDIEERSRLVVQREDSKVLNPGGSWLFSKRWIVSYVIFFGTFFLYALRVNLSVAIVCMVNTTDSDTNNNSSHQNNDNNNKHAEFDWNKDTTSNLLSSYFYGYIVLQLPGGWLAGKFGGARVIGLAMMLSSIVTLLIPISARSSLESFYALRILIGLFAGATYPAFQSMWGRWAPPQERTKLAGFAYSGGYLGSIATFSASGILCNHGFDGGWPSIFYITGGLAFLWTIVWFVLIYDSPSSHPTISKEERDYIVENLKEGSQKPPPIPWKGILTSSPFWALIIAVFAMAWIDYTFLTSLPQYLKDVLDFDIAQNGFLSATPSVCQFISSLLVGGVADYIRSKGVSTRAVRNIFQTASFAGIGGCLLGVGYITYENRYYAVALLGVSGFFAGLQQAGYVANFIDIAPRFAGINYGIGNSIATVSGIVSPIIVGKMTTGKSREEWQHVFFMCMGVCVCAALVYIKFSRGDVQAWALQRSEEIIVIPRNNLSYSEDNTRVQDTSNSGSGINPLSANSHSA